MTRRPEETWLVVSAFRVSLVVLAVVAGVYFAFQLREVLIIGFVALILAAGLVAPVSWLEERGVPRLLALAATYLAVIAVLAVIVLLIVPPLSSQVTELIRELPDLADQLFVAIEPWAAALGAPTDVEEALEALRGRIGDLRGLVDDLATVPLLVISALFGLLAAVFLSALMLIERDRARDWLLRFVAPGQRDDALALGRKATLRLGAFVRGQLFVMTIVGTVTAIGLTLLGVPFALPLGLLAFATEIIPIAGAFIAATPIVLIAFLESPIQGIVALVGFFIIQQIESYVLIPVVQGRVIEISALVALLAVLAGGALAGIIGALLAIPFVAVATVVVEDVILPWRRRQFGSEPADAGAGGG